VGKQAIGGLAVWPSRLASWRKLVHEGVFLKRLANPVYAGRRFMFTKS